MVMVLVWLNTLHKMKFLGLILALSLCLTFISTTPIFPGFETVSAISIVGSDIILASAAGTTLATVPVAAVLLGKAALLKKAVLLKAIADNQSRNGGR